MRQRVTIWLRQHRSGLFICGLTGLFLLLCAIGVRYEMPWVAYSVLVIIALYLLVMHTDRSLYLMALLTPFSIRISEKIPDIATDLSVPAEPFLICLSLLFLWRILKNHDYPKAILRHPITCTLYAYLGWLFVASCFSTMPLVSFKYLLSKLWFLIPCYFYLAEQIYRNERNAFRFLFCYAIGLGIVVCITTMKHIQYGAIEKVAYWIMTPYYNDHTAYGAVLAFFCCLLPGMAADREAGRGRRRLSVLLLVVALVGLYLSFSRAAWLSLVIAIGVLLLAFFRIRFRLVASVTVALTLAVVFFSDDILYKLNKNDTESSKNLVEHLQSMSNISSDASNVERINRWTSAIEMFKKKPMLGWGPGTYQFQYAPFQNPRYKTIITTNAGDGGNAHSEYLGLLSETGIPGPLLLILLIACCLSKGLQLYHRKEATPYRRTCAIVCTVALVSYFAHGFFNNFLDTDKLAVPVFAAMAVIAALDCKMIQNPNTDNILYANTATLVNQ